MNDVAFTSGSREDLRLRDGSRYRIRSSGPHDRERLARCFERLTTESRRLRFFGVKPTLARGELDLYAAADGRDHIALAAVRLDPGAREGEALGFARCHRLVDAPDTAEFSMTVLDLAQGQGVGAALLAHLIAHARAQGIRRLRCEILAENAGMRRLAQRLGGQARWLGDGTLEYACPLPLHTGEPRGDWGLPWFVDPGVWISAGTEVWLEGLGDTLAQIQAANGDWDHWLGIVCPLASESLEGGRRAA